MQYPTKLDILLINILCAIHAQQNNAHQSDICVSIERKRDENERYEDREDKTVKDTHHHVPGPQSQVLGCKSEVSGFKFHVPGASWWPGSMDEWPKWVSRSDSKCCFLF